MRKRGGREKVAQIGGFTRPRFEVGLWIDEEDPYSSSIEIQSPAMLVLKGTLIDMVHIDDLYALKIPEPEHQ